MNESRNRNKVKLILLLLILSVISVIIIYNSVQLCLQSIYPKRYAELVQTNAAEFGLDEELLFALIKAESGFNKDAVSEAGAKGLTQITPETFEWLQTKTGQGLESDALFEPEISVYYGAYFLNMLSEEFENTQTALAAYHAGRGIVNEWLKDSRYSSDGKTLKNIPYEDTDEYVKKVIKYAEKYGELYKTRQTAKG